MTNFTHLQDINCKNFTENHLLPALELSLLIFVSCDLTDTGLEKISPQDRVSLSWTFRSAPLSTPLLIFRQKFERENSHGP